MTEVAKLTVGQLFWVFWRLGLSSFGGPVAHLGYFREEFVVRRRLLSDESYADLIALCQFLPGPASSQVGIAIGFSQAGLFGGVVAWLGFTLPSALLLMLFAAAVSLLDQAATLHGWLHGLKVVAVAVVAQALWGMATRLCPDWPRRGIAVLAALVAFSWSGIGGQLAAIGCGAPLGLMLTRAALVEPGQALFSLGRRQALLSLTLMGGLLFGWPLLDWSGSPASALFNSFFRSGALVFGGGHVVLPLLQAELVAPGWISRELFLAGYGAAQAVPGPLFSFAAFLGTAQRLLPLGWLSGLFCLLAIYLPSFLLLVGILPYWQKLQQYRLLRRALQGINAAVVGLLLAAFIDPVCSSGIQSLFDFALAIGALLALQLARMPVWSVVVLCWLVGLLPLWWPG